MKLPKTVKVGPHKCKVLYPYTFRDGANCAALYCPTTNEIRIADLGQSDTELLCNLWHEIFHAIDKMTGQCRFEANEDSEAWLESLTQIFVNVMLDNKFFNKSKLDA